MEERGGTYTGVGVELEGFEGRHIGRCIFLLSSGRYSSTV